MWTPTPFTMVSSSMQKVDFEVVKTVEARGGVHLSAMCHMPDEDVYLIGGWNNKMLAIFDAQKDNYFEQIMEIQIEDVEHIAHLKYVDELKFLVIGDSKSSLAVYR